MGMGSTAPGGELSRQRFHGLPSSRFGRPDQRLRQRLLDNVNRRGTGLAHLLYTGWASLLLHVASRVVTQLF
jgi:hypothetical protein